MEQIKKIKTEYTYIIPERRVCAKSINIAIYEDNTIAYVQIIGGCNGNGKAISGLLHGMDANEAITKLKNIKCGNKNTSCADQLSKALQLALLKNIIN